MLDSESKTKIKIGCPALPLANLKSMELITANADFQWYLYGTL
jgi:hypothetical protein